MATRLIVGGQASGKTRELVKYLATVPYGVPTLIITGSRYALEHLIYYRKGDRALQQITADDMDHARQSLIEVSRGRKNLHVFIDDVPMGEESMVTLARLAENLGVVELVATVGLEGFYGIGSTTEITI